MSAVSVPEKKAESTSSAMISPTSRPTDGESLNGRGASVACAQVIVGRGGGVSRKPTRAQVRRAFAARGGRTVRARPRARLRARRAYAEDSVFDQLTARLTEAIQRVTGRGRITEDNVRDTVRTIRMAL